MTTRFARSLSVLIVLAWATPALAGGYDTPMLYTARHMGMGGTAIGWVSDPSALFHNPAGLAHVRGLSLMADFSPLLGTITASPQDRDETRSIESETTFAPFFLAGAAYNISEFLTFGVAVFPVASAGATYKYRIGSDDIEDHTKLMFIEITPGLAVQLPQNIRIGAGYRVNILSLARTRETQDEMQLDLPLAGTNFASFRAGAQWSPIPELDFGLVYRHRTVIDVEADEVTASLSGIVTQATNATSTFTLPTRLGFGARGNFGAFHGALDLEYALQSQNHRSALEADHPVLGHVELTNANVYQWHDALTMRVGAEYRLMEDKVAARLGYIFDATTSNVHYPSAFGTPPGPTHVITAGGGYDAGPWEVNLAYAYRFGSAEVTAEDISSADETCLFCGAPGDYAIGLHGIYVDFSIELFRPEPPRPAQDPNADLVQPEPETSAPPEGAPVDAPADGDSSAPADPGAGGDTAGEIGDSTSSTSVTQ